MSPSLYQADRHIALPASPWEPDAVTEWLFEWANAALTHWDQTKCFPVHPRDEEDAEGSEPKTLYLGAMGVWLALERLQKSGLLTGLQFAEPLPEVYAQLHQRYLEKPDTKSIVPSWFLGESALLTRLCLFPEVYHGPQGEGYQRRLEEIVMANLNNPTQEILWGASGTFLAPLLLWEATLEPKWREMCLAHISAIWKNWQWFDERGAWLWEQDLYGHKRIFIGAGHGWAGNLYGLWRAADLLSDNQYNQLRERTLSGLKNFARSRASGPKETQAGPVNWPPLDSSTEEQMIMQWCHGAPGMIWALRHANLSELDFWLAKGGEAIIEAGPLKKGAGLCHGTDGNGYALLLLHQRLRQTPDKANSCNWLGAARQFGTWALAQSRQAQSESGQWRHSLFTGDAGLACFLLDCLQERARWPGLDRLP